MAESATVGVTIIDKNLGNPAFTLVSPSQGTARRYSETIDGHNGDALATSKTGTYYLLPQIPLPLRGEFGGRQLWKRSLDTKDADEARRLFPALNCELEQQFERAREVIARRS